MSFSCCSSANTNASSFTEGSDCGFQNPTVGDQQSENADLGKLS